MDYSKIVFTLEFDDDGASSAVNDYLAKGWLLISVGPKVTSVSNNQLYYATSYVVGATKDQYQNYLNEQESYELT